MWTLTCGCSSVSNEPFEFKIDGTPSVYIDSSVLLPNNMDNECCLKDKIILEFLGIIDKLECGIQPDIEDILLEISLIDMKNNWNFSVAKKVYSSHPDTDDFLRRSKYLGEFATLEEKDKVLDNLGIDGVKHITLSKSEYFNLDEYDKNAIYFVTE